MPKITDYVAVPFVRAEDGTLVAQDGVKCPNAFASVWKAYTMSRDHNNAGAVAFSRTGDPDVGKFDDAVVLEQFGDVPADLSEL